MTLRGLGLALAAVAVAGCPGRPNPTDECAGVGMQASPASATDRWVLGEASRYPADTTLIAQADAIHRSQRARRAAAWEAVARTLAPVPLAQATGVTDATVPRFRTWYGTDDINRTFEQLYQDLGPAGRAAQARFSDSALDTAFGFNARFATTLPGWTPPTLAMYAGGFDTPDRVASLAGIERIAISPDAARHVVSSYPEILNCMAHGAPPALTYVPAPTPQQVARQAVVLGACGTQVLGPFSVPSGGSLNARVTGEGADQGELSVRDADATVRCTATAQDGCTVHAEGTYTVRIETLHHELQGMADVEYTPPTPTLAACLDGVFPTAAATVAEEWRRTDIGIAFPTYDTSADGLSRRLAMASASWGDGDGTATPTDTQAYTMQLGGASFALAGMHIRTRELDHWLNITLWYSPTPDTDFGADRSDSVRALGAPWTSYKMCVATDFDEQDPSPTGGFDGSNPTLAAALAAVYGGQGGPSWCSNPYIDAAPGLVRSNCVGCHQHAMSGLQPGEIQTDPVRFPGNGRVQVRNNFPADQFWGLDAGGDLGAVLNSTVTWWASMM